jgi:hypothetical protein
MWVPTWLTPAPKSPRTGQKFLRAFFKKRCLLSSA